MWCRNCRQDVPGLADAVDNRYGCPRCGTVFLNDAGIDLTSDLEAIHAAKSLELESAPLAEKIPESVEKLGQPVFEPVRPPQTEPSRVTTLRWDAANWELNEKLRHVERVTTVTRRRFDAAPQAQVPMPHGGWSPPPSVHGYPTPPTTMPYGAAPYSQTGWPTAYAAPPYPANPYAPEHQEPPYAPQAPEDDEPAYYERNRARGGAGRLLATLVSWLFLGGAITAFSCGGFLAAWGGLNERPAVQQLGMPIILLGMLSLVIGLLPQIFLRRLEEHGGELIADDRQWMPEASSHSRSRTMRQMSRAPSSTGRGAGR